MYNALKFLKPKAGDREQRGINMVDLMMWLVIAALLLAAAIQGIGYYQQNANIYQMKEAVGVAKSRIMAISATDGSIDSSDINEVVAEENSANSGDQITLSVDTVSTTAAGDNSAGFELASAQTGVTSGSDDAYYIRATHAGVPKYEVIYLFKDTASKKEGTHLVDAGTTDPATPAGGTPSSPSASEPTPSTSPSPTASASPSPTATTAPSPTPTPTPTPTSNGFSTMTITAQNGSPTAENGNGTYYDITSNGNGSVLIATSYNGRIFKSTDSGVTWNYLPEHASGAWQGAAISADGQHLTVSYWDYTLWQTNNGGSTWASRVSTGGWRDVAMSANGQHQIVALDSWHNYYSHNHGVSWTLSTSGAAMWKSVDVSDDGQIMVGAADNLNQIKISKNGGSSWAVTGPAFAGNYAGVSMSSNGQVILAGQGGTSAGRVTVSTDGGATWNTNTTMAVDSYRGTAMSADGTKMIVVGKTSGNVYTSVDSGATWQKQETGVAGAQWYAVTMSEDGKKVAFTSVNGQKIHTGVWQ